MKLSKVLRAILFCGWSAAAVLMIVALIAVFAGQSWAEPLWKVAASINIAAIISDWLWWGLARAISNRHHYEYGDFHHAAEILAGSHLDPVDDERTRLVDWIQRNRQSKNRNAASEREYQMWVFLERRGWSRAALQQLSDEATQGG